MKNNLSHINIKEFWQPLLETSNMIANKKGAARFAYLLLLHHFYHENKFFKNLHDLSIDLIEYVIKLLDKNINLDKVKQIFCNKRQIYRYKNEIRKHYLFRVFSHQDKIDLKKVFNKLLSYSFNDHLLKEMICDYLKNKKIEIPEDEFLVEMVRVYRASEEDLLFAKINETLSPEDKIWIDDYLLSSNDFDGVCQFLRQDSGASNRQGIKDEINRLQILKKINLDKFDFINAIHQRFRIIFKRKFLSDTPERIKRRVEQNKYAIAILYCYQRKQEILDNLADHLLNFIHQMKKKSESKEKSLLNEITKKISDLETLYEIAEIACDNPKAIIEQAIYSSVSRESIEKIIKNRKISKNIKELVRESLIKSYSLTYRYYIFEIINHLEFCSNNDIFLQAISNIKTHQKNRSDFYPLDVKISIEETLSKHEQRFILQKDAKDTVKISKKGYECAILKKLRNKLNHKEIWINGSFKYRNPEEDLPKDFEEKREEYYKKLNVPLSPTSFLENIKLKMAEHLNIFDENLPNNQYIKIITKKEKTWLRLSPIERSIEPTNIRKLKDIILDKWNIIDLLDILKEVDLRESLTECFKTVGNREILDPETIQKRILLCLYAIGTNAGLKRISGASKGSVTLEELRHIKRFFINKDDLREAITKIVNSIFRIRDKSIWGSATTACAADSTKFGAYDQNLMTEWHPRYHGPGVMIYWHVNEQYVCIYSQLKTCTSSEVASMLQGVISHETDMNIESQYVDSHGKSEIGFALTYLLNFDLLPRFKEIGAQKYYLPSEDFQTKNIKDITTRVIDWKLIEEQYNEMVKHAIAMKIGIASAAAIIRKFCKSNYQHPTFKAFTELGKAIKTIFLCRYLNSIELRQQINSGLNVVENWNGANDFIYYGKSGEITSNSREDQEISMLCLHLLQISITYINILLVQEVLQDSLLFALLKEEDFRALTPLFYQHINPYGTFDLDLTKRLAIPLHSQGIK